MFKLLIKSVVAQRVTVYSAGPLTLNIGAFKSGYLPSCPSIVLYLHIHSMNIYMYIVLTYVVFQLVISIDVTYYVCICYYAHMLHHDKYPMCVLTAQNYCYKIIVIIISLLLPLP